MELRYGIIDENVRKRSVEDIILHERQRLSGLLDCRGETRWEGLLAVTRAVNRLAADGKKAQAFSPFVLLPPGTREETLRTLYRQICCGAFAAGLDVTGGHVEVTDAVNRPVVTGEMKTKPVFPVENGFEGCAEDVERSGHSSRKSPRGSNPDPDELVSVPDDSESVPDGCARNRNTPAPGFAGRDIIAAGPAGMEGTFLLATLFREELEERFPLSILVRMEELGRQLYVLPAAEIISDVSGSGRGHQSQSLMVNLSAGGIFAGLWELSRRTGCGFCVDLQAIPLLQETIEITDHFGIHPYMMRSEGCLLAAVPDGERVLRALGRAGLAASRIGTLQNTRDKIICSGGEVRNLDRPQTDTLDLFLHQRN